MLSFLLYIIMLAIYLDHAAGFRFTITRSEGIMFCCHEDVSQIILLNQVAQVVSTYCSGDGIILPCKLVFQNSLCLPWKVPARRLVLHTHKKRYKRYEKKRCIEGAPHS